MQVAGFEEGQGDNKGTCIVGASLKHRAWDFRVHSALTIHFSGPTAKLNPVPAGPDAHEAKSHSETVAVSNRVSRLSVCPESLVPWHCNVLLHLNMKLIFMLD